MVQCRCTNIVVATVDTSLRSNSQCLMMPSQNVPPAKAPCAKCSHPLGFPLKDPVFTRTMLVGQVPRVQTASQQVAHRAAPLTVRHQVTPRRNLRTVHQAHRVQTAPSQQQRQLVKPVQTRSFCCLGVLSDSMVHCNGSSVSFAQQMFKQRNQYHLDRIA